MSKTPQPGSITEFCERCERTTAHGVAVELQTESPDQEKTAAYSREPYRVATCRDCGETTARRMNDA